MSICEGGQMLKTTVLGAAVAVAISAAAGAA